MLFFFFFLLFIYLLIYFSDLQLVVVFQNRRRGKKDLAIPARDMTVPPISGTLRQLRKRRHDLNKCSGLFSFLFFSFVIITYFWCGISFLFIMCWQHSFSSHFLLKKEIVLFCYKLHIYLVTGLGF